MQYHQINLLILLIFHRENGEIWILYVRMSSIAFALQHIPLILLHNPEIFIIESLFFSFIISSYISLSLNERKR